MNEPVSDNQALRYRRLAFYAGDIKRLNESLLNFVKKSDARCTLLIDKDGHLVARQGFFDNLDSASLSALVAGSFASTREVARKLGETEFSVLFHQGANENIHISLVSDRALAVILFDDRTTIGMVRLYAKQVADDLRDIFQKIAERKDAPEGSGGLATDFSDQANAQLDSMFSDNDQ